MIPTHPKLLDFNRKSTKEPKRDADCAHYDRCLGAAARADKAFTCIGCKAYDPIDKRASDREVRGCAALVMTILGPKYLPQYREILPSIFRSEP